MINMQKKKKQQEKCSQDKRRDNEKEEATKSRGKLTKRQRKSQERIVPRPSARRVKRVNLATSKPPAAPRPQVMRPLLSPSLISLLAPPPPLLIHQLAAPPLPLLHQLRPPRTRNQPTSEKEMPASQWRFLGAHPINSPDSTFDYCSENHGRLSSSLAFSFD